jgi:hypothetical protein
MVRRTFEWVGVEQIILQAMRLQTQALRHTSGHIKSQQRAPSALSPGYVYTIFHILGVVQQYLADDLQHEPGNPLHRSEGWAACKFGRHNYRI